MSAASPPRRSRSLLAFAVFLTALALVASAHWYWLKGFVLDPALPAPWRALAVALVPIAFVGMFVALALERALRPPLLRIVSWPFALWMGVFWLGFVSLLFTDAAFVLMGAASSASALDLSRGRALAAGALTLLSALVALRAALHVPRVRRTEVTLATWPRHLDGFRIAQVSDTHIGPLLGRRFAEQLAARVNALVPDLVVVTGDLVDGAVDKIGDEVAPFGELRAEHGVWFVPGNHDFYSGVDGWDERLRELGIRVLRNERVRIGGDAGFDLAGVDDHRGDWSKGTTEDVDAAVAGREPQRALILLAHDPQTFPKAAERGVDLQISGHTHGGQLWPFGALVRLITPYVAGLYARGASQIYVSRGSGFWGPPMRLFAPSEVAELVIRSSAPASTPRE
jgi:predicted MPP superfamily phosphohydrolase